jgi:hypothetical protein
MRGVGAPPLRRHNISCGNRALITVGLNRQQLIEDRARRAAWRRTVENGASFTAFDCVVAR